MLKKASVAIILFSLCSSIFAESPVNKPYLGLDLEWNHFEYKGHTKSDHQVLNFPKSNIAGLGVFGGYRWNTLGMELGYNKMAKDKFTYNAPNRKVQCTSHVHNLYLDGIYYYDVNKNISLKALAGIGHLTTTSKRNVTTNNAHKVRKIQKSKFGPRLGTGFEYYFDRNISSSLMYKIQKGSYSGDFFQTVALGFSYHF